MDSEPYIPTAVYYEDSDRLEYVIRDCACVYEQVDETLDIVRDMQTQEIIGFQMNSWSRTRRG